MQIAIRMFSLALALVVSSCTPTAPNGTAKGSSSPSPPPEPEDANLSPGQKLFKTAFAKAINEGDVNSVCQDMGGSWYAVPGGANFKVCRPEAGYIEAGSGFVQVLWAIDDMKDVPIRSSMDGGVLKSVIFDCAGLRMHTNANVLYDDAGKITSKGDSALGGTWEVVTLGTYLNDVRWMVCKDTINATK